MKLLCLLLGMICCFGLGGAEKEIPNSPLYSFGMEALALSGREMDDFDFVRDFMFSKTISTDQKRELIDKVYDNPGSYPPGILLTCGCSYVALRDFDKGAELIAGGMLRSEIDIRLQGDKSLGSVSSFLRERVAEIFYFCNLTESEQDSFEKARKLAVAGFEKWDRRVSHDYRLDELWEDEELDLTEEEIALITSRLYRELYSDRAPEILEGEDFLAEESDHYFFDRKNRIYYVNDNSVNQFSFQVPEQITPKLSRFGEYEGEFQLSGLGNLHIDFEWSSYRTEMFEYAYEQACLGDEDYFDHQIEKINFNNDMPAYKEQFSSINEDGTPTYINRTCFQVGKYLYKFEVEYNPEDQMQCLKDLEMLFNSINFSEQGGV